MKKCPFCKNDVVENSDTCSQCKRVLVERIYSQSTQTQTSYNAYQNVKTSTDKQSKNYFEQITDKIRNFKWNNFKRYIPIFVILILVIFISSYREKSQTQAPVSVIPNSDESSSVLAKSPKDYASLSNGAILSKNSYYFNGLGQLKINNGTSLDAIAKLVKVSTNKSVLTVYIGANSIYNMDKISDGSYKLFFNLGNDWNSEVKAFAVNSSYEVFEENFDFTTSETRYYTFSVTLNPVVGGQAKTDDISAIEFGSY